MEWFETDTRREIVEAASRFARRDLLPLQRAAGRHPPAEIPPETLCRAQEMGLLTGNLPEDLGGIGLDQVSGVLLWERLAAGLPGAAVLMALHAAALSLLAELRDSHSVRDWLQALLEAGNGRPVLAGVAMPEAVVGIEAPARPRFAAGAGEKGVESQGRFLCLPSARAASRLAILVPDGESGSAVLWVNAGIIEPSVSGGGTGSGLEEVPSDRLALYGDMPAGTEILCTGKRAQDLCRLTLARVRLALAAVQTGNAEAAWQEARDYSRQRVQTGRILCEHQEVRRMLADMECLVQACRSFVTRAAARLEIDDDGTAACLVGQAHRFCDGAAERVCLDAVQVLGGYGYMKDYGLEKRLRDCKGLQALLGSHVEDWLGEP